MKVDNVIRQGDVVLIPINSVDLKQAEEIQPDKDRTILAYGEVTGHAHALPASCTKQFKIGSQEFLKVEKMSTLRHEEHDPIDVPAGLYEKKIAREYTPAGVRKVVD